MMFRTWASLGQPGLEAGGPPSLADKHRTERTPRGSAHPEQWTRNYLSQILPLQGVVFSALAWKLKKKNPQTASL